MCDLRLHRLRRACRCCCCRHCHHRRSRRRPRTSLVGLYSWLDDRIGLAPIGKLAKKMAEDCRVALRNIRRELNEEIKSLEKKKEISEDQMHTAQGDVQKLTDEYIGKVGETIEKKEKEILEI